MINPLALAVQGLGFSAALVAVQGLLAFVAEEVRKFEEYGGGGPKRRTVRAKPNWLPSIPVDEEETLLLFGII
jgi:hypothetical protein